MITVEEAEKKILENAPNFGQERIPINKAVGRILAEDLIADLDFPPFNRVMMDGIAIQFDSFAKGLRLFEIEGISPAGKKQHSLKSTKKCIEVMTGAVLPKGCDTVIPYEDLAIASKTAQILKMIVKQGQNIHRKGSDRTAGSLLVAKDRKLSSAEIGIAATIGITQILVKKNPKILIIATGDELVAVNRTPEMHQIRSSNSYTIQAALKIWGFDATIVHLKDQPKQIEKKFEVFLTQYNTLIISGGVSAGKFDFIPQVIEKQGVNIVFHKVAQRPGKPFLFGKTKENTFIFALPGNPVSAYLCLQRYIKTWLFASLQNEQRYAELAEDVIFDPDLSYFLAVKLKYDQNRMMAYPQSGKGSGDLANLVDADAFLELPQGQNLFKKGEKFKVFIYR